MDADSYESAMRSLAATYHDLRAERDRLRAAIRDAISELAAAHGPEWASAKVKADGKEPIWCRTCGAHDGSWPCTTEMVNDDLRSALDGEDNHAD